MKKTYETPRTEKLEFDYTSTVRASGIVKTPGHDCAIMPNGKDIPPTAGGHTSNKNDNC